MFQLVGLISPVTDSSYITSAFGFQNFSRQATAPANFQNQNPTPTPTPATMGFMWTKQIGGRHGGMLLARI
jgi:hypothetical protein